MSFLRKLFSKKVPDCQCKMPTRDEITEHMQDIGLSCFTDDIVRVFSSGDRTKRIIILHSKHGYFKTAYEEIRVWDEDEWKYFCRLQDRYPAYWEAVDSPLNGKSFYGTEEDALNAVTESHEYESFFT